jgi:alpha-N-arabinofuranosidase
MTKTVVRQQVEILFNVLFFVSLMAITFSCSFSNKKHQQGKSVAFFDSFSYKGEDDYYSQNLLPGNDYYYNPILPGWYSDPSICTNGKDYFMVTSTFVYFPGVPIFHSNDLVNWKQIGHVLDRESQLVNMIGQHTSGGIFAPAISYNPYNQTYYLITTNVGAGNFFVKTKDPFGAWSDPIMLPEVQGIDPSFFFDDDGKVYIVNNDAPEGPAKYDGHRAIRVQEFDVNTEKTFGPRKVLVDGGIHPEEKPVWIEGPHIYKINGQYYLMAAEGGTGPDHSEVILRSDFPMGPYKAWDKNPILTQRGLDPNRMNPITCAGHADMVQTPKGDWWAVFLACRPIDGKFENLGRETFLMPVRWSCDGFPFITQNKEAIPMIVKRKGVEREQENTFGNFSFFDDFDSTRLGMEWMTLRTQAKDQYSLTDNQGCLSLSCADVSSTETKTPSFICRRIQHHKFECVTELNFSPADTTESAGLLMYKDERHQYYLAVGLVDGKKNVALYKLSQSGVEVLATGAIGTTNRPIQLKVISQGTYFDFYYKTYNEQWKSLVANVDAHYLSTANSFGFTGTTIGMYATKKIFSAQKDR